MVRRQRLLVFEGGPKEERLLWLGVKFCWNDKFGCKEGNKKKKNRRSTGERP